MTSYDFDLIEIDWDIELFYIYKNDRVYEYNIADESTLLTNALSAGVDVEETGTGFM